MLNRIFPRYAPIPSGSPKWLQMFPIAKVLQVGIAMLIVLSRLQSQLYMTGGPRHLLQPFGGAVQLHKAENTWRLSARRLAEGSWDQVEVPEKARIEALFRKMCSILNKLTPEVFPLLGNRERELNIDTEERLRGITTIIFENAIAEVKFCSIYAQLCHCLREVCVPDCPFSLHQKSLPSYAITMVSVLQTTGRKKQSHFCFYLCISV